jgi:mxaC protein
MTFDHAWVLLFLPLALLPFVKSASSIRYSSLALIPRDRASAVIAASVKVLAAIAIAALIVGLAGPYRRDVAIEQIGRGAEIVLLLDRSRSMDQSFRSARDHRTWTDTSYETKAMAAARLLSEFAAQREQDLFGMMVFSTLPMPVLDFTRKQEVIQAAIAAGDKGKGLADTEIGAALEAALALFASRPYQGSRVILLVSDGGAHIDFDTRARIAHAMKRQKVALYWIYLRSFRSPGLNPDVPAQAADSVPEYFLHRFFQSIGSPYQAFEAENPQALERAIAEIDRLEDLPIRYTEIIARQDLSQWCFGAALIASLLLAGFAALEMKEWR